jgi:hypothetical protein
MRCGDGTNRLSGFLRPMGPAGKSREKLPLAWVPRAEEERDSSHPYIPRVGWELDNIKSLGVSAFPPDASA